MITYRKLRVFAAPLMAWLCLAAATPASAVTLAIAENSRVSGGIISPISGPGIPADATDNQFQNAFPDDLNAAFESAGAFTGPFGASEIIQVFGLLVSGQDPVFGEFASPFTVTLNASAEAQGTGARGRFEIRAGGTDGTLVSATEFTAGESNIEIFDSSDLDVGIGVFEIRIVGTGLNTTEQSLIYDYTIAGFTEIPLPASLPLLLGGLAVFGFGRSWARRPG